MVYYADSIDQVRKHTLLEEMREGRSKEAYVCVFAEGFHWGYYSLIIYTVYEPTGSPTSLFSILYL